MTRLETLKEIVCPGGDESLENLLAEFVFIESQMAALKTLPFIRVHPSDPARQRSTPAAKLYKELLQQYTNILKILLRITGSDEADETSPLRMWVETRRDLFVNADNTT